VSMDSVYSDPLRLSCLWITIWAKTNEASLLRLIRSAGSGRGGHPRGVDSGETDYVEPAVSEAADRGRSRRDLT
jgi:hypothetical protein